MAPAKSEPEFAVKSPLQPMRRVEAEAVGRVIVAAMEKVSAPSRNVDSVGGADEVEYASAT